ncbi:probable serine/threonine-protein kinase roco6 isoform X5 [Halichondria panicea]|uniref:probable serine/threonine-protein kinase roco6 isoform X5 n=1 Tax=Halichondria panicea TaxID=6063 RepID=UPI00312B51C1
MSDYLTIEDLGDLYIATFDARIKWRNFLLVLKIPSDTIDSIGTKWRDDPDDCYREGLKEWLKGGERSWEDVFKALSSPIVGHSDIARTIEKDRLQSTDASNPTDVKSEVDQNRQKINDDLTVFLDERLGKGAFGAVFKGSYKGEICAVKVLLHDAMEMQASIPVGKNEEASVAIDRESDFLKSFQHPNVVQFLSTAKHPKSGSTILVVELMDCNLRSYFSSLDEESLTSECEINLSKDMACGLAYIHSKQIIHRDLCGDNILLKLTRPVPVAKISDFGMSRLYDPSKLSHTLTAIGHRMGYLPLEAIRLDKDNYDNSLDVFSLGAIMMQIVCKLKTIKSVEDRSFHVAQIPHTHRLRKLIDSCLQEDMRRRPSARDIYTYLTTSSDPVEATKKESKETEQVKKAHREQIKHKDAELVRRDAIIQQQRQGPPLRELRPSLTLKWRSGTDMPTGMGYSVQSVVIGDTMYVGGGTADNDRDRCTVMKLEQDQWTKLPEYTARFFAMTSLANRLVLVGGQDPRNKKRTNQLAVFVSGEWTHPYPPINIARDSSTAVSFNNHIIVAGGRDDKGYTSSVEVLDVASRRWYIAQSLPNPRSSLKSTLVVNTLYLMGGYDHRVYHVNLNELIAKALSNLDIPTIWQTLQEVPLVCSVPLSIGRSLLAISGADDKFKPSSSIHLYQPDTRRWVKMGDLPTARYYCTCSVLPSGEVIVAGGETNLSTFVQTVDFFSISAD